MKKLEKNILKRTGKVALGLVILGLGVSFFLYSGLGADPNSVFVEGLGLTLGVSYGTASLIINSILASLVFVLNKSYINIATIACLFIPGYSADFFLYLFHYLGLNNSFYPLKLLYVALSLLVLSFAIAFYISQQLGIGALDAIPQIISDKSKLTFATARKLMDILALILGLILGGTFGLGTIVLSLGTGPMVGYFRERFNFKY